MFKFNRNFKRIVSLSTLAALECCQNLVDARIDLSSLNPRQRRQVWDTISWHDKGRGEIKRLDDSVEYEYNYNRLSNRITDYESYADFIPVAFDYGDGEYNAIFIKKQEVISVVPYGGDQTIINLLPQFYSHLGDKYKIPEHEAYWWENTDDCKRHLQELEANEKTKKTTKGGRTYLDDVADYLGISRNAVIFLILGGSIIIIGGTVWIIKSLLNSVGKAGSDIIHGRTDNNPGVPAGYVALPVPAIAPQTPNIVINTTERRVY